MSAIIYYNILFKLIYLGIGLYSQIRNISSSNKSWTLLQSLMQKNFYYGSIVIGVFVDMPRIFEAAMDKDMLNIFNEKNIILMNNGSIVAGMNDRIIGVAKLHEM
jgi:hypothetical protein